MAAMQPQQEIFEREQYFWYHDGNEHIESWLSTNSQDYPDIYATYINDANAVVYRKRVGKPTEYDQRMLTFLEQYPMTHANINWSGVGPHKTGMIDVLTYNNDPQILAQARDLLYKHVFDVGHRHQHWVWRGENGLLNRNEVEPLSKKQKSHLKSKARWDRMDEMNARLRARGITADTIDPALFAEGPGGVNSRRYIERLMLDLEVGKNEENQSKKADNDTEME
ncbi:unnamed protein product [Aureobasidium mustum]|uniref:Uncharacterized protein n=1 Tax=Aureobasidium mustum TaxID=2773714 RepID=A0A9N8JWR9_9PEZI|nr:unnamed protein product [Aureobasidium mustum]